MRRDSVFTVAELGPDAELVERSAIEALARAQLAASAAMTERRALMAGSASSAKSPV